MIGRDIGQLTLCFSLALTAAGQTAPKENPQGPPQSPATSTVVRSSATEGSSRQTRTRTQTNGREVVTETTELPGPDGRLRTMSETTTETIRVAPDTVQSTRSVFGTNAQGQRQLLQSSQSDQQTLPGGASRTVENTWVPDLNGRLELTSRQIQETRLTAPDTAQTDTTILRPGVNEGLRESERVQQTERKAGPGLTQTQTTRSIRDVNGRWQTTETRSQEVRTAGAEKIEEESVRRPDGNGTLVLAERKLTRQSTTNGQDQVVTEIYSQDVAGQIRHTDNRLDLDRRIRVTTTPMTGGGRETVREVEARNPVAPNDGLRIVERSVERVRQIGPGQWETQRQTYGLDGNGRLVLIRTETEESSGK